jgi:tetratricopeptide (TPR) repeat protein
MASPHDQPAASPREKEMPRSGHPLADLSQLDFDIEFYGRVLARQPGYVDVLRCQGQLLSRKGLHEQALEVDRRLVGLTPRDCVAHYNLACRLARLGRTADALEELSRALEEGYRDFEYLHTDGDLDTLRNEPGYAALLRRFGAID